MSKSCVFFDRDGIVNEAPVKTRYVERLSDFHLLPGFVDALRVVKEKGWEAVVITNQKGVGAGCMSMETLAQIHDHLRKELRKEGLDLLDILVCTDTEDSSPRRKPNPGMLLEAAEKHGVDLKQSWMVGDNRKDIEAGRRAGCKTVFVGSPAGEAGADHEIASVSGLASFLRRHL